MYISEHRLNINLINSAYNNAFIRESIDSSCSFLKFNFFYIVLNGIVSLIEADIV